MYKITIKEMESLKRIAASLTLNEGLRILHDLNPRFTWKRVYADNQRAKSFTFRCLKDTGMASNILMSYLPRIWFHGGPPGAYGWYSGTPCDFFVDCVLVDSRLKGVEAVADVIRREFLVGAP